MKVCAHVVLIIASVIIETLIGSARASAGAVDQRAAVEAVIRASETAFAALDCAAVDAYFAPGARWIEGDYPQATESTAWCKQARSAGVRMTFDLHDLEIRVLGSVAWATVVIDGHFYAGTPEARALLGHGVHDPAEWLATMIDSVVLRKTGQDWLIVLEHRSLIPPKIKKSDR